MRSLFLLLLAAPAAADPVLAETPPTTTISLSALHLVEPVVEASAELRVADRLGVAVIGELGRTGTCGPSDGYLARRLGTCSGTPANVAGAGAQLAYYLRRSFVGLHAALEVDYQHVATAMDAESDTSAAALIGYKLVVQHGVTFGMQGGVAVHRMFGQLGDDTTASPLVRLTVGWSR